MAALGTARARGHLRHGLPDARWHRDPRLHPRRGPRGGAYPRARLGERGRTAPRASISGTGVGSSVREVIALVEEVSGPRGAGALGRPAARRRRRGLGGPGQRRARPWAGRRATTCGRWSRPPGPGIRSSRAGTDAGVTSRRPSPDVRGAARSTVDRSSSPAARQRPRSSALGARRSRKAAIVESEPVAKRDARLPAVAGRGSGR